MHMTQIVMTSRVGPDGTLTLALPADAAGQEVRVTVEPTRPAMTQEEWRAWVDSMAGSWQGDFERMPQGEYEDREPLS
jgi:hypothetical protein